MLKSNFPFVPSRRGFLTRRIEGQSALARKAALISGGGRPVGVVLQVQMGLGG